jgi:hypothetical protein
MVKKVLEPIVEPLVEEEVPVIADIPDSEPEEEVKSIQKSKKPRTQAQIDAFAKVILKRTENSAKISPPNNSILLCEIFSAVKSFNHNSGAQVFNTIKSSKYSVTGNLVCSYSLIS